ncbi:hypothetical protein HDU91_003036, partial [Kappamyces sp. JEL0680]
MLKQFLNVEYNKVPIRINTTEMNALSELKQAVETIYSKSYPEMDADSIQFTDKDGTVIVELNDISDEYYVVCGQSLTIHLVSAKDLTTFPRNGSATRQDKNVILDGIDPTSFYLPRATLVDKVQELLFRFHFVVLCSPVCSGKTSVLQLVPSRHSFIHRVYINCSSYTIPARKVLKRHGIDLRQRQCDLTTENALYVVMLDNAQAFYSDVCFWTFLIKVAPIWLPANVRFIISATHLPADDLGGHIGFSSLPRLSRKDFLLCHAECCQMLSSPSILPTRMASPTVVGLITRDCGGLVGAVQLAAMALKDKFAQDPHISDNAVLLYYLSNECLALLSRCFGSRRFTPFSPQLQFFLEKCLVHETMIERSLQRK